MIKLEYDKPIQRRTVWVIIMSCIHRKFNDTSRNLRGTRL